MLRLGSSFSWFPLRVFASWSLATSLCMYALRPGGVGLAGLHVLPLLIVRDIATHSCVAHRGYVLLVGALAVPMPHPPRVACIRHLHRPPPPLSAPERRVLECRWGHLARLVFQLASGFDERGAAAFVQLASVIRVSRVHSRRRLPMAAAPLFVVHRGLVALHRAVLH